MKEVLVKTEGLKKYYSVGSQVVKALDGVDFEVREREFVSIIGKSGSGKSTLLHMLGGLDTPTEGTVIVDGMNLAGMNGEQLALFRRRKVGFIFQQYNLIPDLNVFDNIVFPLELDGAQIDRGFVRELTDILHISDKMEMLPGMLSGGEQQRVAIVRALVTKPAIILADEPTGNLDTAASHDVIGLLKVLARQYQQTIILITHDGDIAQMADRTVRIEDGKIQSSSGVERVLSRETETGQGRRLSGEAETGQGRRLSGRTETEQGRRLSGEAETGQGRRLSGKAEKEQRRKSSGKTAAGKEGDFHVGE